MLRGQFTESLAKKHGLESVEQLRLIPYLQYLLVNHMPVDPAKITALERKHLQRWRDDGKITFSSSEAPTCTKAFWDWINEILWDAYVPKREIE